ncbi:MAG: ferrous iron transport protein B [Polyangiaceae bacterium]|nr:ferrous iron transport protein B [Polyangiaceae bacterium]
MLDHLPGVAPAQRRDAAIPVVVVVGNPNVGKTSLFNALTGSNARIGNYPGITVERRSGVLVLPDDRGAVEVVDVPGAYSLSARSADEQIAIAATLGLRHLPEPRLAVVVVDAGQLVRNLYLVLELVEARVPIVVALNMIDEVRNNPPRPAAVSMLFGVPCVATDARHGGGLDELRAAIANGIACPPMGAVRVPYPAALMRDVDRIAEVLPPGWRRNVERDRALALWALGSLDEEDDLVDIDPELRARCLDVRRAASGRDLDAEIVATRYGVLDRHAPELCGIHDPHPPKRLLSERLDRFLLHPKLGFAIFVALMLLVFHALFSWADPAISLVEAGIGLVQRAVVTVLPHTVLRDLLTEGVLGGVGNVVVFLPQILLLFFFIGLLEDSGYMSRVAFLMDRLMKPLGLHGRAFVPMLSGLACAVPAIMATRTMERQRDRLLTMLVVPLMTCSARLPVYTLIIGALFPPTRFWGVFPLRAMLLIGMYCFSVLLTILAAGVLGRTILPGRRVPLILELPPYRLPSLTVTLRLMVERALVFLKEAGTVILVLTILLWALLSFPRLDVGDPAALPAAARDTATAVAPPNPRTAIEHSYAGRLGRALEPALTPLGFDWGIGVGLIGSFAAREVFVSTMALVYGIGENDGAVSLRERIRGERREDGSPVYTPLVGLSLLVFMALACQCMSTLAVVHRETRSWRWPLFLFTYTTTLAWVASFLVYQTGRLLGFE